jgi:hypothetical protein
MPVDTIDVDFSDIERLKDRLEVLVKSNDKVARSAAAKALTPIRQAFKKAAPPSTGESLARDAKRKRLAAKSGKETKPIQWVKSPGKRTKKASKKTGWKTYSKAGLNVGKPKLGPRAFHVTPVLLPKEERYHKSGHYTGRVRSHIANFYKMRQQVMISAASNRALSIFEKEWIRGLQKAADKLTNRRVRTGR